MKVQLLTNLGSNDFPGMPFMEGDTHEVTEAIGAKLVGLKLALDVTPPAVPEPEPIPEVEPAPLKIDKFQKMRGDNINPPKSPASTK